jgi:hypothetical protein
VADVEKEVICGGIENPVKRNGQLDNTQIWSQMAASLAQDANQLFPYLLRKLGEILNRYFFDICGTFDRVK